MSASIPGGSTQGVPATTGRTGANPATQPSAAARPSPRFPGRSKRGATVNMPGRYECEWREPVAETGPCGEFDGFFADMDASRAHISVERPRKIITRNDSPDISFDQSINPYRGCEHGCSYCFARPTHAYMGLSPGLDFEQKLFVKKDAAVLLEKELSAPGYQPQTIAIGTNTDPYQPIERHHRVMRSILEVLARANHPVGIVTKSALVTRDIDLLAPMAQKGLVKVALSITTLDGKLSRAMEPRAAQPQVRIETIRTLARAGIPVSVMVAPVIPAVTDHEMETILTRAHEAGAREAGYILLRLPLEVADIFRAWLAEHFPERLDHVMALVRGSRGGKDYESSFGMRMTGSGPYAWMLGRRFEIAARRNGYHRQRLKLRTDLFRRPVLQGQQMSLF
ncbi:MAG: PA0069 family radical SAM protein [Hyphomicrobiales bacterium]|nr:PA0069 family radical SAM protein [Hyphomicrobiales bacterium]